MEFIVFIASFLVLGPIVVFAWVRYVNWLMKITGLFP